jgi:hypothetical protein
VREVSAHRPSCAMKADSNSGNGQPLTPRTFCSLVADLPEVRVGELHERIGHAGPRSNMALFRAKLREVVLAESVHQRDELSVQ